MVKLCYYIENSWKLEITLEIIQAAIPSFVSREYVEMNYSQVTITARQEDAWFVEAELAPLI